MIANIQSGDDSSYPRNLTAMGGKLYFSAENSTNGRELWVYDPSKDVESGVNPIMVADIWPGSDSDGEPNSSYPDYLTAMAGKPYFNPNNGTNGYELRFYDPSKDVNSGVNPRIVADINSQGGSDPQHLTELGGKLYFSAENDENGIELCN